MLLDRTTEQSIDALADALFRRRTFVLTGAGCSTESGIPDYRGPETRHRPRRPVQYREFVDRADRRVKYWARSTLGWPRFRAFQPNDTHRALAAMESSGLVETLVTQNVDRLHTKAGSQRIVELHGALHETLCLGCGARGDRDRLQERLLAMNPGFDRIPVELAPDGDTELSDDALRSFQVPACEACDGVLKPDVVFFGENVPRPRVEEAYAALDRADLLLVVGSSLTVFSGYRFVRRAKERGVPVAIVNLGETRGDGDATHRVDAPAGVVMGRVAGLLGC